MEGIAKINVLQKSEFHDFGMDLIVFFECLGHNFHDFWCLETGLEFNDFRVILEVILDPEKQPGSW